MARAIFLLPAAVATAAPAARDVESDEHPGIFDTPGIIATLAVAGVSLLLLGAWLVRERRADGAVRLPSLLMTLQVSSVLVVAIGAWVLTFLSALNSLHDTANQLIIKSGEGVKMEILNVLGGGEQVAQASVQLIEVAGGAPGYPRTHTHLARARRVFAGSSVTMLYYGTERGEFFGVGVNSDPEFPLFLHHSIPASNESLLCPAPRQPDTCLHPACNDTCGWCRTDGGVVPGGQQGCSEWRPAVRDRFVVYADRERWDIPERTPETIGYCAQPSGANTTDTIGSHMLGGGEGRSWANTRTCGCETPTRGCSQTYDPRVRAWYVLGVRPFWAVYNFASIDFTGDANSLRRGLTVSLPVRGDVGEILGVVGVDFTLRSLSEFLLQARPTPGSQIFVVEQSGLVLAASLPVADFSYVQMVGNDTELVPYDVLSDAWGWSSVFRAVVDHYGSISAAAQGEPYILQTCGGANLAEGTVVDNLRWLLVIHVPYSDITGDAEAASVMALAIVVAVGLCSGFAVSALTFTVLRPLQMIVSQMALVAQLQVDDLQPPPESFARELCRLRDHFLGMVEAVRYYRDFVPQSMVTSTMLTSTNDADSQRMSPPSTSVTLLALDIPPRGAVASPERRTSASTRRSSPANVGTVQQQQQTPSPRSSDASRGSLMRSTSFTSGIGFGLPSDFRLVNRRVTLLAANVRRFLSKVDTLPTFLLSAHHTSYVARCVDAAKLGRGVADSLLGDRVLLNFNGVRTNSQHALRATQVALLISQPISIDENADVCSGVASGKCLCGNMGAAGLKTFAIVGPPASVVYACERAATRWVLPCVLDTRAYQEVSCSVVCKMLCVISHSKTHPRHVNLYEPRREAAAADPMQDASPQDGEWMYQVGTEAMGPYNAAAERFLNGSIDEAKQICDKHPNSECVDELHDVIAEAEASGRVLRVERFDDAGGIPVNPPLEGRRSLPVNEM